MTVIIRPSPEIFRRRNPMVVVFGAFRLFDAEPPLKDCDVALLRGVIANARRYRQTLAFSRPIDSDGAMPQGTWLPGCRPRISDRLFEHRDASCFSNPDFVALYQVFAPRQIFVVGPENDSCLAATLADRRADPRQFRVITPQPPLQNCSAAHENAPLTDAVSPYCAPSRPVDYFLWLNELRTVEYS